jgi:hypothetical protein
MAVRSKVGLIDTWLQGNLICPVPERYAQIRQQGDSRKAYHEGHTTFLKNPMPEQRIYPEPIFIMQSIRPECPGYLEAGVFPVRGPVADLREGVTGLTREYGRIPGGGWWMRANTGEGEHPSPSAGFQAGIPACV